MSSPQPLPEPVRWMLILYKQHGKSPAIMSRSSVLESGPPSGLGPITGIYEILQDATLKEVRVISNPDPKFFIIDPVEADEFSERPKATEA